MSATSNPKLSSSPRHNGVIESLGTITFPKEKTIKKCKSDFGLAAKNPAPTLNHVKSDRHVRSSSTSEILILEKNTKYDGHNEIETNVEDVFDDGVFGKVSASQSAPQMPRNNLVRNDHV